MINIYYCLKINKIKFSVLLSNFLIIVLTYLFYKLLNLKLYALYNIIFLLLVI